jgi:hypothetical protein
MPEMIQSESDDERVASRGGKEDAREGQVFAEESSGGVDSLRVGSPVRLEEEVDPVNSCDAEGESKSTYQTKLAVLGLGKSVSATVVRCSARASRMHLPDEVQSFDSRDIPIIR